MIRNKYIKILMSTFLLLMAIWVAVPKVYIHELLHHGHNISVPSPETKVQSQSSEDCDFDEYNKPVYFNIFKFISSFIPVKSQSALKVAANALSYSGISHAVSLLRGPPVTE